MRIASGVVMMLALVVGAAWAQEQQATPAAPAAKAEDVKDPQAIVAALYNVISGPAGQKRDWDRFRSLYAPGAHLTILGKGKDGKVASRVITPEEYIERSEPLMMKGGWFEREIASRSERFGNMVNVWTTYAGGEDPKKPDVRGINSITLMCAERCWITSVTWEAESPENPLPAEYLPK